MSYIVPQTSSPSRAATSLIHHKMAKRSVRFEFVCDNKKFRYNHDLPVSLIGPNDGGPISDAYMNLFRETLEPIMSLHEPECRASSNKNCGICGEPISKVLTTPMSYLHIVNDPQIHVWANPVCAKATCETQMRQSIQKTMSMAEQTVDQEKRDFEINVKDPMGSDQLNCKVCGKKEGVMRCSRCKTVGYCGKEHQAMDWKSHKRSCKAAAS